MRNLDLRMIVAGYGLTYKEIAAAMGVSARHLSRLLAGELQPMTRERIICAIEKCIEVKRGQHDI